MNKKAIAYKPINLTVALKIYDVNYNNNTVVVGWNYKEKTFITPILVTKKGWEYIEVDKTKYLLQEFKEI